MSGAHGSGSSKDSFSGSITVITGASRGIGRAIALGLGARGGTVVINFKKNADLAGKTLDEVRTAGGDGEIVRADVENPDDITRLFDRVRDRYGRIDHFVSNAAASAFKPIRELKLHHLDRSYAMNIRPFVLGAQRAVELMTAGGRIVALTSYGSIRAYPTYANLGSAKAAIEAWVRYMAVEFGPVGVSVNAVNGGIIDTDSAAYFYDIPGMPPLDEVLARLPKRRMGTAAEMAAAVLFLLSPGADYITGQTLVVDGGLSVIAPPFHADAAPPLRLPERSPRATHDGDPA